MKQIAFLFGLFVLASCKGQVDLESLKFGNKLPTEILNASGSQKEADPTYNLSAYKSIETQKYKFGGVDLSKYSVPQGFEYSQNSIYVCVDNYQNNNFLGCILTIVKKEEEEMVLQYLKKKYGEPENRETGGNGFAYFWNVDNKWIFLTQKEEEARNDAKYLETKLMIVKSGTRVANSTDEKTFTILESFNQLYPKK